MERQYYFSANREQSKAGLEYAEVQPKIEGRAFKDSGIEWIGRIPREWNTCRFKNSYNKSNVGESIDKEYCTDNITDTLFYTAGLYPIHTVYKDFPQWKFTQDSDLLLARNGTPYIYLPLCNAVYSDHIIRVDIKECFCKKYIRYCLQQAIATVIVDSVSIATWSISLWNEQQLPFPSLSEQQRIAEYLDEKCGEIDALIALQEQMIAQLTNYKQSVITEAVTKGLNPDAHLVPSGIDSIGDIPEHWGTTKIKMISSTNSGSTPKNISDEGADIIWIRTTDLNDDIVFDSSQHLTSEDFSSASCPMLDVGTCVVAMYGGGGTIGKCGILGIKATINQALCAMEVKESYVGKYLFCVLRAMKPYWMKYAVGTRKDPNINQDIVKNMSIPYPPLFEQESIAEFLSWKCVEIDKLIATKRQKIETLKEYKKSVIYEAVTGKKIIE